MQTSSLMLPIRQKERRRRLLHSSRRSWIHTLETSITPIYSLLRHGVGDSKAFATVYAAMCRQADLECKVVTGTKEGEPWVWNMICVDGVYAHVDLLESLEAGRMQVRYQNEMDGYVWDYSAYPEAIRPEVITTTPTEPQEPEVTEPTREETEDETVPPGEGEKEL